MNRLRWWQRQRRKSLRQRLDSAPDRLYVDAALVDRAISLIQQDLIATLGWSRGRARELAEVEAASKARLDIWDGDVLGEGRFILAVAEEVQQDLHDTFEDTTWPSCPRHPNHPLWLRLGEGPVPVWQCTDDQTDYGNLGELPTRRERPPG